MSLNKVWIPTLVLWFSGLFWTNAQENMEVEWYSFEEAIALNEQEPRKIFIDIYTDWCGWCKKLDKETFRNPVIVDILNTDFYAVKFNAESKDPVKFAGRTFINEGTGSRNPHQLAVAILQGKMQYPSAAYMDENLQLLTSVSGFLTAQELEPVLSYFSSNRYKNESYQEFTKTFRGRITAAKQ